MPSLKQSGKITNYLLEKHMEKSDYEPMRHTPALWKRPSHNIVLILVVDDFRAKYTNRQDAEHLRNGLQILYPMTTDWKG